ncbi:casein kinase I-like [Oppia nitens]|uniref:casein kinase I-like n=1 Tax=Oppia nitens TaxID=1686743 RepID=UPI0023DA4545|nr:casein kinase I-like [Oppia nitens]
MDQLFKQMDNTFNDNVMSTKRSLDNNDSQYRKRCRDKDMDVNNGSDCHNYYITTNCGHSDDNDDEEEDDDSWYEMSEDERRLMDINNLLVNISLNRIEIEWPDIESVTNTKNSKTETDVYDKFPPKLKSILFGYRLDEMLSVTKRSAIFVVQKVKEPNNELILKVAIEGGFYALEDEIETYIKLTNCSAVSRIRDYIRWKDYKHQCYAIRWGFLVIDKMGLNLTQLMSRNTMSMIGPMAQVFKFAVQMIDCVQRFHSSGYIHCAINPQNIILESDKTDRVRLISLSYAKSYVIKSTDGTIVGHIDDETDHRKIPVIRAESDPNFRSIGFHNGYCQSRRDDMESLGYCMIYLATGTLPWISAKQQNLSSTRVIRQIGKRMQATCLDVLCDGLPQNFIKYFDLISNLKFKDEPNYQQLKAFFQ